MAIHDNLNSSLDIEYYADGTARGSTTGTYTTSITLEKGKYIVFWTSSVIQSKGWQTHDITVSGGTHTQLKRLANSNTNGNITTGYADCYEVEITSDSGVVTGIYTPSTSGTVNVSLGFLQVIKIS